MTRTLATARLGKGAGGQALGVLGGTFDPAHGGHLHVALTGLKRLGLDRVWLLVAAGNPLKPDSFAERFPLRLASATALAARRPRIDVAPFEGDIAQRYTADVIAALRLRRPHGRFVWLMGSDSLLTLHRWRNWESIAASIPLGVVARPGSIDAAIKAPAARALAAHRLPERSARLLASARPPAWVFLHGPLDRRSSTRLRREGADGPS